MSRSLSQAVDLPADVERTWAVLTSSAWPTTLDARLEDGSRLLSSEVTPDGGALLVTSRRLPDGIPSFLLRFAPRDGRVTQTDRWGPARDGVRRGTWEVTFPGSPGEVRGETWIEPDGDGCRWVVSGHVKVGIPVVGGRAESFLAPVVEKLVARQGDVLRDSLT